MSDFNPDGLAAVDIMRSVFGDELVGEVHAQLRLPAAPRHFEIPTDKIAILPFSARSGSTFAAQLLTAHPAFRRVTDWFLPSRLEEVRVAGGHRDHAQAAQRILRSQARAAFGTKCIRQSLIAAAYLGIIDQFLDHIAFFIIDRKDKVAQAVSFHKAQCSGRFHSGQEPAEAVSPDDFDFDRIYVHYTRFRTIGDQYKALGEALGKPMQRFWYEELVANPSEFLKSVNHTLGLPLRRGIEAEARVEKLSDAINAEWAERFRAQLAEKGLG